jgi:hypothetical protein
LQFSFKDTAWGDHWDEATGEKMELNPHIPKPDPPKEEEKVEEKKEEDKEKAEEKKEEEKVSEFFYTLLLNSKLCTFWSLTFD